MASERAQGRIRFALLLVVSAYAVGASLIVSPTGTIEPWARAVLAYFAGYALVAACLLWSIDRYPGHYPGRRLISMASDYAALAFCIVTAGEVMLPAFALVMWVTVGNGLRFGPRYMLVAAVLAQVTLAAITALSAPWRDNPALVATFALTALVVPFYVGTLLRDVELARRAAEEANTAKSRFLAQASHDLRQPVHAIGLFLTSLTHTRLTPEQRAIVDRIDRSLQGVAELFRSLLDISTLDSGAVAPVRETVSVAELFRTLAQQNQAAAHWSGVDLRFVDSRRFVLADRALLLTMLQNLVSNAIKYAPRGPVLVGCRRRGDRVSICVADRGPGIADDHLPHLFDEFYRVQRLGAPDTQGAGLGLSIVKRLGGLMGLNVTLRSRPGYGTAVAIDGLVAVAAPPALFAGTVDTAGLPLRDLKVLLVEDDPDVLDATAHLLRSWGAEVAAWSAVPPEVPPCDLVLTDFDIGGGRTGADCLALYHGANPPPMAIVMTGHDETTIEDLVDDLACLVLKKPVRPAELRSAIAALRRQRAADGGIG